MSKSQRFTLLILFSLSIFLPSAIIAESESNNTIASANSIEIGYANAETNAMLDSLTDVDFYSFSTPANQTYVIETFNIAGSASPATSLRLYNASGTELAYGLEGSGNANRRIVFTFITAGTYYLKVAKADYYNWTGSYSLRILPKFTQSGAAWDASNDMEPNDTPEVSNQLNIGLSNAVTHSIFDHSAYVTSDGDQDFYHFDVQANQTFVIETFNIAGNEHFATSLRLYNASGTMLANGLEATGNVNKRVVFTFITAGTYYVRVARADYLRWIGTYSLRVLPKYDQPGAEWDATNNFEPDDVIPLANLLNVGPQYAVTRSIIQMRTLSLTIMMRIIIALRQRLGSSTLYRPLMCRKMRVGLARACIY